MAAMTTGLRPFSLIFVLGATLALAGCAEKARSVQVGAVQFQATADAAIDSINALRKAEVAAPPQSASEAADTFVKLVEGSKNPITRTTLDILADPVSFGGAGSAKDWDGVLVKLRGQYATFAAVFASLDQGSLLAAPVVKQAIAPLDKLTVQMAALAKSLQAHPARFVVERGFLAADIESVRDDTALTVAQRRTELLRLRERLMAIVAREERVTADAVSQCLKTAKLGLELRKLLAAYDTLTLDDLMAGLAVAFRAAGMITGRDLSGLQARTDGVISELTATPALKALFDAALDEAGASLSAS